MTWFLILSLPSLAALALVEWWRRYVPYCGRCGGFVEGGRCAKCGARP